MKILHIINKLSTGGAQSLVANIAIRQAEKGDDVTILELMPSPNDILRNQVVKNGVRVETHHPIGNVYNPFVIFSIIPILKKYDLVHVHLFPAQYWVAMAKMLSRCKTPLVTTEHSTNNKRRSSFLGRLIDKKIYSSYDKVIACSDGAKEIFAKQFPGIPCLCVPNGINVSQFHEAEKYEKAEFGLKDTDFMVTMVARFDYPKRQDTIVNAIAKLSNNFHAVFVGGTPEKVNAQKCMALAKENGVSNRIHFLYIRSDVQRILKTSDAIVMSSEYEGLSLSSIEGMAVGKPFLASNVNGLKEVVDGAGLLFELGNSSELASLLLKLSKDQNFYDSVATQCMQRAREFDISATVDKYNYIYKDCLL